MTYKTLQYKSLCDFFHSGNKEEYSSEEIISALCSDGTLGKSTVYRQLSKMTEAGELRRFHSGKHVFYQFAHRHSSCDAHFHLKCEGCGKLIHLDCEKMISLVSHIAKEHGFSLDMQQTVLYGKCEKCSAAGGSV